MTSAAISPEKLLQLRQSPEPHIVSLADSVLVCQVRYDMISEIVVKYRRDVLFQLKAHPDPKWIGKGLADRVILDPNEAFLLSPHDYAFYDAYSREAQQRSGLKVDKPDHCPQLEAQTLLDVARYAFIEALTPYTGITVDQSRCHLKVRDGVIELGLSILSAHLDPHKRFGIPKAASPSFNQAT